MANPTFTAQQNQNLLTGYLAANTVYDINNTGGVNLVKGQPFRPVADMAGQPGYTNLPIPAPTGFIVREVFKNPNNSSGLDAFIAYNPETHTAMVGIAGVNGVGSTKPGSFVDTAQALQGFTGQIKEFFKEDGLLALRALSIEGGRSGADFKVIIGAQSGGGPLADALAIALTTGLRLPDGTRSDWGVTTDQTDGIPGFSNSNLTLAKYNTAGSEVARERSGLRSSDADVSRTIQDITENATTLNLVAQDKASGVRDPINSLLGTSLGLTCLAPTDYDPQAKGFLAFLHRLEGGLSQFLADNGSNLNACTIADPIVLPFATSAELLKTFQSLKWEDNNAGYGGLFALSVFVTVASRPGEPAAQIGALINAYSGGVLGTGLSNALGAVVEGAIKLGALANPGAFLLKLVALFVSSKIANQLIGSPSDEDKWLSQLAVVEAGGTRTVHSGKSGNNSGLAVVEDHYADRTVFKRQDGVEFVQYTTGDYKVSYADQWSYSMRAEGGGTAYVKQVTGLSLPFSFDASEAVVANSHGGLDLITTRDDGSRTVRTLNNNGTFTQQVFDADNTLVSTVTDDILWGNLNITNTINLTTTVANTTIDPGSDPTNAVSLDNSTLALTMSYRLSGVGNVNTATGNVQAANAIVSNDLRPGANEVLHFDAWDSGLTLKMSTSLDAIGAYTNSQSAAATTWLPVDPLILDLNGDGVKLTSFADAPVLFDIDHDGGSKELTGWVSNADGIVVMDLNNNGVIDGIHETFSEYFNGAVGTGGNAGTKPYANGFAALKSLDSNADNQFTSADAAWANVRVWVDANHDGKTDAGELKTLASLSITRINLSATTQSGLVNGGNEVLATGTFTQNGLTREAQAARFIANPTGNTTTISASGATVAAQDGQRTYVSALATGEVIDVTAKGVRHAYGGSGNDTLTGNAEANWLVGGLGSDIFNAGDGDDTLLIDAADLQQNVHAGAGFDMI